MCPPEHEKCPLKEALPFNNSKQYFAVCIKLEHTAYISSPDCTLCLDTRPAMYFPSLSASETLFVINLTSAKNQQFTNEWLHIIHFSTLKWELRAPARPIVRFLSVTWAPMASRHFLLWEPKVHACLRVGWADVCLFYGVCSRDTVQIRVSQVKVEPSRYIWRFGR